jgi:hypothetical protein
MLDTTIPGFATCTKTVWFTILATFIMVTTAFATHVRADDAAEAVAVSEFKNGVRLFKEKNYEKAVLSFRRANELKPSWKISFNIGQCEAALKRYGLSIESFEHYLGAGGDDIDVERRDYVYSQVRRLRDMVGSVRVKAPAETRILVDGVLRGRTPLEIGIRVTAGVRHRVEFEKHGEIFFSRQITLGSGQTQTVECLDEPEPVATGSSSETAEPNNSDAKKTPIKRIKPTSFWVGVGATGLFGAGAIVMEIAVRSKWDQAEDEPSNQSLKDEGKSMQTVGIVALCLTGVAAVATSVIAGFTDFKQVQTEGSGVALTPVISKNSGGLTLTGRF